MKINYDSEVDVLTIEFTSNPVHESDEGKPGVIMDYDKDGNIVSIEVLQASKRTGDPRTIEYGISEPQKKAV